MHVKYDEEELRRALAFLRWDFINGNATIELDENGDMHFYKLGGLKLYTVENILNEKSNFISKKTESVFVLPNHH